MKNSKKFIRIFFYIVLGFMIIRTILFWVWLGKDQHDWTLVVTAIGWFIFFITIFNKDLFFKKKEGE